jgi:hypothetical protein
MKTKEKDQQVKSNRKNQEGTTNNGTGKRNSNSLQEESEIIEGDNLSDVQKESLNKEHTHKTQGSPQNREDEKRKRE